MTATWLQRAMLADSELDQASYLTYDIGVDVDDVLYPWYETAHKLCEKAGITNGIRPKTWRMADEYGCDIDLWANTLKAGALTGEMYGQPPIPGAVEALRRLMFAGHRIHLITARGTAAWQPPEEKAEIHRQSLAWFEEYAVPHDTVTFASDKATLAVDNNLDYFIDDGVHNFQDLEMRAKNCVPYLLTAPHNGDFYTPFRLETMDEFAELVIEAGEKGAIR